MKFRGYNIMYNKTITITICRAVLGVDQKDFVSIFYILQKLHHFICVILGIIWSHGFNHTVYSEFDPQYEREEKNLFGA